MKKLMYFIVAMSMITACNQDNDALKAGEPASTTTRSSRVSGKLDVSSYAKLERGNMRSQLNVDLKTMDGQKVDKISLLRSNTTYKLSVTSIGADQVEARSCFGFEILGKSELKENNRFSVEYLIKTSTDVSEPLFVSFLPLRHTNRSMIREQAQNFFLAKN